MSKKEEKVKVKIVVSDPSTGKSQSIELDSASFKPLIGRKIGDIVDGSVIGLKGCKLQITGGSDRDGFPMRPDVMGGIRTRILLSGGVGFNPRKRGERRRKTVRGNTITEDIVQVNMKIVEVKDVKAT